MAVGTANDIPGSQLKTQPFFAKNPDNGFLYTGQPPVSSSLREELLANEIPALTFAAGHRGVEVIREDNKVFDIDIRQEYAVGKPWPANRPRFEWRHSDIYNVAYPYLSGLYIDLSNKVKGVIGQ
jgi:hypothetical protein